MRYTYFACANTYNGFISRYDEIFGLLPSLYIIKGGPGTGKSSLIARIANEADKRHIDTEMYLCSSDPTSFDGIIIPSLGVGIIDGTQPHSADTVIPGARDELVNLGVYWNSTVLKANSEEINRLNAEKKRAYSEVFAYLGAVGKLDGITEALTSCAVLNEKIEAFAKNTVSRIKNTDETPNKRYEYRYINSIGMYGEKYLSTFEELSESRIFISDKYGIADIALKSISKQLENRKIYHIRGLDAPSGKICGIFIPKIGQCFVLKRRENAELFKSGDKIISTERFIDRSIYGKNKNKITFCEKCKSSIKSGIEISFECVKESHFALERIYGAAMNFKGMESLLRTLTKKIFND